MSAPRRERALAQPALALVFVALLVAGIATRPADGSGEVTDAVGLLVGAYERSRTATYVASGTRSRSDGTQRLDFFHHHAQRAPDRLRIEFGDAIVVDGDLAAVAAAEVTAFAALVTGADRIYDVDAAGPGCFRLTRRRIDPARARYGAEARLCFDPSTGAVVSVEADHGRVVETLVVDRLSAAVRDADLDPASVGPGP